MFVSHLIFSITLFLSLFIPYHSAYVICLSISLLSFSNHVSINLNVSTSLHLSQTLFLSFVDLSLNFPLSLYSFSIHVLHFSSQFLSLFIFSLSLSPFLQSIFLTSVECMHSTLQSEILLNE